MLLHGPTCIKQLSDLSDEKDSGIHPAMITMSYASSRPIELLAWTSTIYILKIHQCL